MEIRKDRAVLRFHHADNGLVCKGKTPEGLAIAGEDGVFVPAKARIIQGNMLEVYSPKVKHPVAVRYCFDDATVGNLFNADGLPMAPFRTDYTVEAGSKGL